MLFGSCTICLNVFRMGYDVSHIHCKSEVELIFPVVEIVFMSVQVMGLSHPHTSRDTRITQPTLKPATEVTSPFPRVPTHTKRSPPPRVRTYVTFLCTCAPPHIPVSRMWTPINTFVYMHLHILEPGSQGPLLLHLLGLFCAVFMSPLFPSPKQ